MWKVVLEKLEENSLLSGKGDKGVQSRKNIIWNAFGNIIYLGCQWLVTVFVTRIFGLKEAGMLSLAMSISAMFQTIALFGIRNYQVSDTGQKYTDGTYMGFRSITCIVAMLLCILFSHINRYGMGQLGAIFWFMLFRLAEDYSDALYGIAQKNGRLDIVGRAFTVKGVVSISMFFGGCHVTGNLGATLAIMAVSSWISTGLFDLPYIRKKFPFELRGKIADCLLLGKETFPLCVYMFLLSAISSTPKYILEKICDTSVLGAYSSIFAPALLIQAAAGYIYSPFVMPFAEFYQNGKEKDFLKLERKLCLIILEVAVGILVLGGIFGIYILRFIFGEVVYGYESLLIPVLFSTILLSYLAFYCMLEVVMRDFKGLIVGCMVGEVFCVVATPFLIYGFGANGASYGLGIGAIAGGVYMVGCMRCKWKACRQARESEKL